MAAFGDMFPGRKPEQKARDEESNGQDPPFGFVDGPLDLASGVVRIQRRRDAHPADTPPDPPDSAERG